MKKSLAVGAFILLTLTCCGCSDLLFFPDRELVLTPATLNLKYDEVYFEGFQGIKLHGWFLPAEGRALGTIMFLHGNAQNISTHLSSVYWLPARHYNVFLWDYRGYGQSAGHVDLDYTLEDIDGALRYLFNGQRELGAGVVVFGQSLGGSLAIYALTQSAYHDKIKALVVEGAFADYHQIVREKAAASWLTWPLQWPASRLVSNRYSPLKVIDRIAMPILIVHGEADRIVPYQHSVELFRAARDPKTLWLIPEIGHIQAFQSAEYRQRLTDFLERETSTAK